MTTARDNALASSSRDICQEAACQLLAGSQGCAPCFQLTPTKACLQQGVALCVFAAACQPAELQSCAHTMTPPLVYS